ncbi:bifunctional phosphopantothenoylcysteine decarboxylase/phosphopantothenate--cysteine ligase CoaBC [Gemella haemolysans]|uniref:Coenzyme A biosynthesis bifunctional protein CoaBC n=1 Tax=Gemella haemolysans ATCC 10379 TaxID=546270 RepID=C5NYR9_9BACL|nr:bifunctional phosphopantothenoylcysteine decarboxylase/phosphopantothenate--cysteine ligase CoaBC [Gemella haemolysans]EER67752.1 phosphopantothenoylcysteine decarboxylase/phosphopantothenate--cysteine ligase [Gemella haemolysans ATCC 10379]KAA8709411.1 bifunctional phosphopantothenoylcysteine decarboxylase/phosphopantothenate--cysteine ligase CoaBC [Gemella haemolysans]UBH83110.1 bifunctional phosphopantothenoylcysteine decarboxylase/phosphopantothenate--cysteine ligase CoaBC [Gemella haemol
MNILLIVSGGIAAYKSIDLCSSLVKQGNNVKVILTKNAENFVTQLPFQTLTKNRVYTSTFEEVDENEIQHIDLTKWAEKIIVAPATANLISKFSNGIADDLATSLMLAVRDTSAVYIVPAMNTFMYRNPIIQDNMNRLIKLGFNFVEPDSGLLACGDVGEGKFPTIDKIESFVFQEVEQDLKDKKVLVTAGPTKEFIDPFRCLTNPSTGKMGISIANECARRGAEVILVSSVDNDSISNNVKKVKITSTNDMFEAVKNNFKDCDFIIKAAAVSDYTPVQIFDKKVKKQDGNLTIEFQRTQDILKYVGDNKHEGQKIIGFAAETNNLIEYAKEKIVKKNLDYIVANDISKKDIGFGSDDNEVYIIDRHDNIKKIDKSSKNNIAKAIVDEISK